LRVRPNMPHARGEGNSLLPLNTKKSCHLDSEGRLALSLTVASPKVSGGYFTEWPVNIPNRTVSQLADSGDMCSPRASDAKDVSRIESFLTQCGSRVHAANTQGGNETCKACR